MLVTWILFWTCETKIVLIAVEKKGIIEKPVSSFYHDTLAISLHINAINIQHE